MGYICPLVRNRTSYICPGGNLLQIWSGCMCRHVRARLRYSPHCLALAAHEGADARRASVGARRRGAAWASCECQLLQMSMMPPQDNAWADYLAPDNLALLKVLSATHRHAAHQDPASVPQHPGLGVHRPEAGSCFCGCLCRHARMTRTFSARTWRVACRSAS
jgi:hypothetical protein